MTNKDKLTQLAQEAQEMGMYESLPDPWNTLPSVWKTKSSFFSYLRGQLRKGWNTYPIKLKYLNKHLYPIPNPNPKGKKLYVKGGKCSLCNEEFVAKDLQVDHIVPAKSLSKTEHIQGFVERLFWVDENSLRLVCKNCNNALAMADRYGISYEESIAIKQAKEIQKDKKDLTWLLAKGIVPASRKDDRKGQIVEVLLKEGE